MTGPRALDRPAQLTPGDHASWVYDDHADLREACVSFFSEGARRGERLMYLGAASPERLLEDLREMSDLDRLLDLGQLSVHPVSALYGIDGEAPRSQADGLTDYVRTAVAHGYTGLRILGDVSELAADPRRADVLMDAEVAVHPVFAATPTTAVCAIDRTRAPETWRPLSALHHLQRAPRWAPTFTLHLDGGRVHLGGEIDAGCVGDLQHLLHRLGATTTGELSVVLPELGFIDVAGTRALAMFRNAMTATGRAVHFQDLSDAARRTFPAFRLGEQEA